MCTFTMYSTFTTMDDFKAAVLEIAKTPNAKIFNCYIIQEVLVVATAAEVHKFNFSHVVNTGDIVDCIESALKILHNYLPQNLLLFHFSCAATVLQLVQTTSNYNHPLTD